jgi:hypothetical protein
LLTASASEASGQELTVSIRLYNEQVYFPDSEIFIHVTIENQSPQSTRFRLSDNRMFNIEFDARTESNDTLSPSRQFTIGRGANQVFYRTVELETGERLSFVETLGDYVSIDQSGMYTVQARFYPELFSHGEARSIFSNQISVHIRPGQSDEIRTEQRIESVVERRLRREDMSPDRVVSYTIGALQEENWDRFFLYLNDERLYRQTAARDRSFRRLSQEEQLRTLSVYREDLRRRAVDEDQGLVLIPDEFEIVRTEYTATEGSVVVMAYVDTATFRERRQYTYYLERRAGYWEIVGYQVELLGNEALPR